MIGQDVFVSYSHSDRDCAFQLTAQLEARGVSVWIEEVLPAKSLEYFLSTQHWLDAFPPPRQPYYANLAARVICMLNDSVAGG